MSRTPTEFVNYYSGKAIDFDHSYGVQCVDGFRVFCQWAYGTSWPTGTGYADGYWYSRNVHLDKFVPVSVKDLKTGDWVIWSINSRSHPSSHIAMYYHGKEFGQNQSVTREFCLKDTDFSDALGGLRPVIFYTVDAIPYAVFRLYNKKNGDHLFTASAKEASTARLTGLLYEGVAWKHDDKGTPVKRLYNAKTGEHFYSIDAKEVSYLKSQGWKDEGTAFGSGNGKPVYRLYNGKNHFFTANEKEKQNLIDKGWKNEGVAFKAKN